MLSANCQGLRNNEKCHDVISYLKQKQPQIVCLQDTHWMEVDKNQIKHLWGNKIFICEGKRNLRGVAILLNSNFEYNVLSSDKDINGNYLGLFLKLLTMTVYLLTIYGPNTDKPEFYQEIDGLLQKSDATCNIICGDFNLVLNPDMDTYKYKNINNPKTRNTVVSLIESHSLLDIYRQYHPQTKRYSWHKRNPIKQARLDFFLVMSNMCDIVTKCDIKPSYRSDHSILEIGFLLNNFSLGKG